MSDKNTKLSIRRAKRVRFQIRKKSNGKLRLTVFRSSQNIYAQVVDDRSGITLVSASTLEKDWGRGKNKRNIESATKIGSILAERLLKNNIKEVVFDRGPYLYHGCVKAVADGARSAGIKI